MARPRWKGRRPVTPPRETRTVPRRRGLPSLPQGHSGGHTARGHYQWHDPGESSHLNPRLPGLPGHEVGLSGEAGEMGFSPRNMHVSTRVESVVSCQFKCSNSGRLCGPGLPCSGIPPSTPGKEELGAAAESEEPPGKALPWGALQPSQVKSV